MTANYKTPHVTTYTCPAPDETLVTIATLRDLIANDAYAASFQTMGQYRQALMEAIKP